MNRILTDPLTETAGPVKEMYIPGVTGRPVIHLWSLSGGYEYHDRLRKALYALLPNYWIAEGIVDCKILQSSSPSAFIVIESWSDRELKQRFARSDGWQKFLEGLKNAEGDPIACIKELVNDVFELIE